VLRFQRVYDNELCVLKAWLGPGKIHFTGAEWAADESHLDAASYSSVLPYCRLAAFGQSNISAGKI